MRRSRSSAEPPGDRGSASLEFLTVGLLLLVPTVYLVLALSALQSAAFAVEGAVRQATRVFVQGSSTAEAQVAAARAIEVTLADYGIAAADADVTVTCQPNPSACLTRQGTVTVTITVVVTLPLLPPLPGLEVPAGIPVTASATEQVSRFGGSR